MNFEEMDVLSYGDEREKKGEDKFARLVSKLIQDGRYEDLEKAANDKQYRAELLETGGEQPGEVENDEDDFCPDGEVEYAEEQQYRAGYEAGRLAEKRRIAAVLLARYADEAFVADVTELSLETVYEIQCDESCKEGIAELLLSLVDDGTLTVEEAAEKLGDSKDFFLEELKKHEAKRV